MPQPWNNWFHCTCNTFGIWLPGDHRGWSTRHHRQHIEPDPDSVPRVAQLPKRPPVRLSPILRNPILDQFVSRLQQEQIEIIIASLDDHHLHLLARIRDHQCRHWLGLAKKHTSLWARDHGNPFPGGLWAAKCGVKPVRDREHQLRIVAYILDHQNHGAAIWSL